MWFFFLLSLPLYLLPREHTARERSAWHEQSSVAGAGRQSRRSDVSTPAWVERVDEAGGACGRGDAASMGKLGLARAARA